MEKIQRMGQDAQTPDRAALVWVLKRELASVGFVVDSLSDIVDALEGTEREPQGWTPASLGQPEPQGWWPNSPG